MGHAVAVLTSFVRPLYTGGDGGGDASAEAGAGAAVGLNARLEWKVKTS